MQPGDIRHPAGGRGLARAHLDADAAAAVHGREPVLVGNVVTREHGRAPGKRGASSRRPIAVPLSACVGRTSSTIFPCIAWCPLCCVADPAMSSRNSCSRSGARRKCRASDEPLSSGTSRASSHASDRNCARTSANPALRRAPCTTVPSGIRSSSPCRPAAGSLKGSSRASTAAIGRPLTIATAPSNASAQAERISGKDHGQPRVNDHRIRSHRDIDQSTVEVQKERPCSTRGMRRRYDPAGARGWRLAGRSTQIPSPGGKSRCNAAGRAIVQRRGGTDKRNGSSPSDGADGPAVH